MHPGPGRLPGLRRRLQPTMAGFPRRRGPSRAETSQRTGPAPTSATREVTQPARRLGGQPAGRPPPSQDSLRPQRSLDPEHQTQPRQTSTAASRSRHPPPPLERSSPAIKPSLEDGRDPQNSSLGVATPSELVDAAAADGVGGVPSVCGAQPARATPGRGNASPRGPAATPAGSSPPPPGRRCTPPTSPDHFHPPRHPSRPAVGTAAPAPRRYDHGPGRRRRHEGNLLAATALRPGLHLQVLRRRPARTVPRRGRSHRGDRGAPTRGPARLRGFASGVSRK